MSERLLGIGFILDFLKRIILDIFNKKILKG